jgi:hypothetical protein
MRQVRLVFAFLCALPLSGATTINVGSNVTVAGVHRFGISGISHYYYDRLLLKNLITRNAGFEGLLFQAIMRCDSSLTANSCVDSNPYTAWPTGFWNGATYEFVLGNVKGRSGTVATSTAPVQPYGTTWTFADSSTPPAQGDYFVVRKFTADGADIGWGVTSFNGATYATETADLPPNTEGRQCLRLSADGQGQTLQVASAFGSFSQKTFMVMNGTYRISFKAKGTGGLNRVAVAVLRGDTILTNQSVALTNSWGTYDIDFAAAETGVPSGFLALRFTLVGSSMLLDDASLVETNGDASNTTAFRDTVMNALRPFRPGILRSHQTEQGDSIDDLLSPPFGRVRTEYHASATNKGTNQYGYHEFLELCESLGAEPYLVVPITLSDAEAGNLIEYLAGPVTSPYGARRAARGHPTPWTDTFTRIHLEFGNESWNGGVFLGATMFPPDYGRRGSFVFGLMRSSPYYSSKFNLILGVQAAGPANTMLTHNASTNHDMLAIGPYMATRIDDYENNERLFGGLFAEASWWSKSPNGFVKQTKDQVNASTRPVPLIVYEVNMHTTEGSIPQSMIDLFAPSIGAGLAVADHMLNMLREQQVRDQLVFSLGGYRFTRADAKTVPIWGIVNDLGVTDRKRPQYLALQLVNEALSGDLVGTTQSGDNPMWSQALTNRIAMDDIPYIQSFAFVNGLRRAVVLFNLHRALPLEVTLTGPNAPSGQVTMKRLGAAAITDSNEDANNVTVTTTTMPSFDPAQPLSLPPYSMTLLVAAPPPIPPRMRAVGHNAYVDLDWDPPAYATSYDVLKTSVGTGAQVIATVNAPHVTDFAVTSGSAYIYRVRAIGEGGTSAYGDPDVAVATAFSDDPVVPAQTIIRRAHVIELRSAIDSVRSVAGRPAWSWGEGITAGLTWIRAAHFAEMQSALIDALDAIGVPHDAFRNISTGSAVAAADIQQLRTAVR